MAGESPLGDRPEPGGSRRTWAYLSLRTGTELPVARVLWGGYRACKGARRGGRGHPGGLARRRAPLAPGRGRSQLPGPCPGREPGPLSLALRGADGHHGRPAPRVRGGRPAVSEFLGLGATLPAGRPLGARRPRPAGQPLDPTRDGGEHLEPRARRRRLSRTGLSSRFAGLRPLLLRADARGAV